MKGLKALTILSLFVGLSAWMSGCGSSGTGSNSGSVNVAGYTTCTTSVSGSSQTCLPGLVSSTVHFQGPANITNPGEAKYFIRSFPQFTAPPGGSLYPINNNQVQTALIDVLIQANGNGPAIMVSVNFPNFSPVWFSGPSTFNVLTGSSNPNVGQMLMQPFTPLGTSFGLSTLTQPWDGSVPYLTGVTVSIDSIKLAGTAVLQLQ